MDWINLSTPLWLSYVKENTNNKPHTNPDCDSKSWWLAYCISFQLPCSIIRHQTVRFCFFYWTIGNTKKGSLTFQQPKISITPSHSNNQETTGPYKLLGHNHKYFILLLDDVQNNISIDKLAVILAMSD